MKVLREDGPAGRVINQLEEFLRVNKITIFSRNELFVKIGEVEYEVRDADGGSGGGELPRTVSSEKLVLT
jgi:hypothetical protein